METKAVNMEMVLISKDDLLSLLREVVKDELCSATNKDEEKYLSPAELSSLFKITLGTVHNWTKAGLLKKYHMGKRKVFYKHSEVIEATKTLDKYKRNI